MLKTEIKPVDLGLNVLWADRNIGSINILDYGDLFMWGNCVPAFYRTHFNDRYFPKNLNTDENYRKSFVNPINENIYSDDGVLKDEYDAASVIFGNGWRLPTRDDVYELISSYFVDREIITNQNGLSTVVYKSKMTNQNLIFPIKSFRYFDNTLGYSDSNIVWTKNCNKKSINSITKDANIFATVFAFSILTEPFLNFKSKTDFCYIRPVKER